ncbi:uncharacterized protein PG986_005089 [Apiospora aurea]|uniref:Heterokaryon incompatibility domain-containing protein n=1 Tax=Apiospora aurea TaxID=335848 RepID=A0ABR1QGJ5_9PEZI
MSMPIKFIRSTVGQDYVPATSNQRIAYTFEWDGFYSQTSQANGQIQHKYYSEGEREAMLQAKCTELAEAAGDSYQHIERLEAIFEGLLKCQWSPRRLSQDSIVQHVDTIQQRLPAPPTELSVPLGDLAPEYFSVNETLEESQSCDVSTTKHHPLCDMALQEALSHVGELIDTCTANQKSSAKERSQTAFYVAGAYLWTFWQRARTLFAYFRMHFDLRDGFRHGMEKSHWMRSFLVSPNVPLRALTDHVALARRPANMCGWIRELLLGDPRCLGLDFAVLHSRFRDAFGAKVARCRHGSPDGCLGKHWRQCRMFYRENISPDQTMHDTKPHNHDQEHRVLWDKDSYLRLSGPRAVSVQDSDERWLRYCPATNRTMAISHVWSRGQGGRPGRGINACLHQRYMRLARKSGCDSYWIAAACIGEDVANREPGRPEDDDLRAEAMKYINTISYTSTCHESVLTTVLFSEWNTRAWTMLEALKGRDHITILGQGNGMIRFMDLLNHVHDHGRIDLVVFAASLSHMMRSQGEPGTWLDRSSLRESIPNDIPMEIVGSWLSHRPVTRPQDEVVIWSLCLNQQRQRIKSLNDFWRAQETVQSGSLLSSAPRLAVPGFRWAPSTPVALPGGGQQESEDEMERKFHRAFESCASFTLRIYRNGLWGAWWTCDFSLDRYSRLIRRLDRPSEVGKVIRKIQKSFQIHSEHMMLFRPKSDTVPGRLDTPRPQALVSGSYFIVAVCESDHRAQAVSPKHEEEPEAFL